MYPTTSPSTSVTARSVSGITSPSIEKPVRPSRSATLNDGHPMYASFPIRRARFSPTRCQYWIVPSTPAFSLMSWISDTRATSSMFAFLLSFVYCVPPLHRRGDETVTFEVGQDLPERAVLQARRPPEGREGEGLRHRRQDAVPPRRCGGRRRLPQPPLQGREAQAERLDGLAARVRGGRRLHLGGEVLQVAEGARHLPLEAVDAPLERLQLRARALPRCRQRERLVDGVLLALDLDQRAEVLRRMVLDRFEQVAPQLLVRHLHLSRGDEALLDRLRDPHMEPMGPVEEQVRAARLQPQLLEGVEDVLLRVVDPPRLLQLGNHVVQDRLVRGLEDRRRDLRDVERLAVADLVHDVVDARADPLHVLLDGLEVRVDDAPPHLVPEVVDVPEHAGAEGRQEVAQGLDRLLELRDLRGELLPRRRRSLRHGVLVPRALRVLAHTNAFSLRRTSGIHAFAHLSASTSPECARTRSTRMSRSFSH